MVFLSTTANQIKKNSLMMNFKVEEEILSKLVDHEKIGDDQNVQIIAQQMVQRR